MKNQKGREKYLCLSGFSAFSTLFRMLPDFVRYYLAYLHIMT